MGSINKKAVCERTATTHEGAKVFDPGKLEQFKRLVMTCMLWEDTFYVDGKSIADSIVDLVNALIDEGKASEVYEIAHKAKHEQHLRHTPLLIGRLMVIRGAITASQLNELINRVDDIPEFLTMYWGGSNRKITGQKLSHVVRKGLSMAFRKFNEYSIAKYQKKGKGVSLRDVMQVLRVKPNKGQEEMFRKIKHKELKAPDTWEAALSGGADKKETFERLMSEGKLGALATLRNMRNMISSGVSASLIATQLDSMNTEKILPFHFIKAYEYAPKFVGQLNAGMMKALEGRRNTLKGKTIVLLDKSGSMADLLSEKSELTRSDAAKGLAILLGEVCEEIRLYQFARSCDLVEGDCENGLALLNSLASPNGGTDIEGALRSAINNEKGEYDRIIILTDEQSHTRVSGIGLGKKAYILNVSTFRNGVGYEYNVTHINGWSDKVIDYIVSLENP